MTDIQDAYEDFCTLITDKTEPLPAYKFFEAGYKAGWNAAVEETKKACVQAVGNVVMKPACHWSMIKNAIMQAKVE